MKIISCCFLLTLGLLISCKKSVPSTDYSGTYTGNVEEYLMEPQGWSAYQSWPLQSIQISETGKAGMVSFSSNMTFKADSAIISGNMLQVPKTLVDSTPLGVSTVYFWYTFDVGTGTFSDSTLTIDLYENSVSSYSNTIAGSYHWAGILTKK
jgi:hypothetical protein